MARANALPLLAALLSVVAALAALPAAHARSCPTDCTALPRQTNATYSNPINVTIPGNIASSRECKLACAFEDPTLTYFQWTTTGIRTVINKCVCFPACSALNFRTPVGVRRVDHGMNCEPALETAYIGWWSETGSRGSFSNYFTGLDFDYFHSYFVFDVPTYLRPCTGAKFQLSAAFIDVVGGTSETLVLSDFTGSVEALAFGESDPGNVIFNDLADGVEYGSRNFTLSDTFEIVTITLNAAAVDAINAAGGGLFALGGKVSTLESESGPEGVFGFSSGSARLLLTF